MKFKNSIKFWLLILPVIGWCYIGLFLAMRLWYPAGLPINDWQNHVLQFSIIYCVWVVIFFAYRLFDFESLRSFATFAYRFFGALFLCAVFAALYFYFQPDLLITPRRFLIAHIAFTGTFIVLWYSFVRLILPNLWQSTVFAHSSLADNDKLEKLLNSNSYLRLKYEGILPSDLAAVDLNKSIIILPSHSNLTGEITGQLFALRSRGVQFIEYHELYEKITRTIHLEALTEIWFLQYIDYRVHRIFDFVKRIIDIVLGLVGTLVFILTLPVFGLLIKLTSRGPLLFVQSRVGQYGKNFNLYKYRTMTTDSPNNTWAQAGQTVTWIGKILRATRVDELPQSINILKGDMSIVGPRPEQVGIVENLREHIPYYDERHIVKPGLTGWAQLHVYASSVEETKRKLQYDLYYIKHRSLLFDAEIILKTVYNIITFAGQ